MDGRVKGLLIGSEPTCTADLIRCNCETIDVAIAFKPFCKPINLWRIRHHMKKPIGQTISRHANRRVKQRIQREIEFTQLKELAEG